MLARHTQPTWVVCATSCLIINNCLEDKDSRKYYCRRCDEFRKLKGNDVKNAADRLKPKISRKTFKLVDDWLKGIGHHSEEIACNLFNVPVTQAKLSCLDGNHWLNDEIVNLALQVLHEYNAAISVIISGKPSCVFNSFFYFNLAERMKGYSYKDVMRWTKKSNIFLEYDKVYIPIHAYKSHWFLVVLFMQEKCVRFYDSLSSVKDGFFENIMHYLTDERAKLELNGDEDKGWRMEIVTGPRQQNGYDCGVFTIIAAEMVMLGLPMLHSQQMMPTLRRRIAFDILEKGGVLTQW